MKNQLFPIFLKAHQKNFLIIGGGNVGLEKLETLTRQSPNASVKMVAIDIFPNTKTFLHKNPSISFDERAFEPSDLQGIDFLIIATNDTALNLEIITLARKEKILINAADQPDLCDFYLGSYITKGDMKIAISTNGKSPVLARRMREYLEKEIPENIDESIKNLNEFRNKHKGNLQEKLQDLNKITQSITQPNTKNNKYKNFAFNSSLIFLVFFLGYGLSTLYSVKDLFNQIHSIPNEFYYMIFIGFLAQLVDGAIGLGFGVVCSVSMLSFGFKLPIVSGSIHTAELFTSGISGYSHYKFGNVNKKMFIILVIPAIIGAIVGSLLLINFGERFKNEAFIILAIYTFLIGIRLIILALKKKIDNKKIKKLGVLGFLGGFFDAFAGGGWGPIVTSTLLSNGKKSKYVVGTVSLTEFFVTLVSTLIFFYTLGITYWHLVLAMIIGSIIASPIAVRLAGKLPQRISMISVAILVIIFSIRMIIKVI